MHQFIRNFSWKDKCHDYIPVYTDSLWDGDSIVCASFIIS